MILATELDIEELQEAAVAEEVVVQADGGETNHRRPLLGLPATVRDLELDGGVSAAHGRRAADKVDLALLGPGQVEPDSIGQVLRKHSLIGPGVHEALPEPAAEWAGQANIRHRPVMEESSSEGRART